MAAFFARFRRVTGLPVAGVLALSLVGGCLLFGARVDSSWGPLPGGGASPLAPDLGPAVDLPRFSLRGQTLPSGLRLGLEAGTAPGLVTVVTVVGSGSSADPPGREGLAHLVEHLAFHAHAGGARSYSDRLARLGASYNADTGLDATRFYEVGPAVALPVLLQLASERLLHPMAGVDEGDLERERAIVENELNQRNEIGVYGNVMAWIQRSLFPAGHPYVRPVGGSPATLRGLTLADARAFAAAHYRPDNASILVTGDTDGRSYATAVAALGEAARARPGSGPRRHGTFPAAPDVLAERPPDVLRGAVAFPEIWIAYDLGGGGEAAAITKVLTARAGEEMVRERLMPEREVLAVDFHVIEQVRSTFLACQIVLDNDRRRVELAQKAQNLIWALWSDSGPPAAVTWEGWRQGTVGDLRQAALADAVLDAEPFLDRALGRAVSLHVTGAIDGYDRMLAAIAAVRPEDVSGRAFTVLAPERARTLFLEPTSEAERRPPGPVGVASAQNLPFEDSPFRAADFGAPPRVPAPAGLSQVAKTVLPNGLTVFVVRRPQFPSVTALLGFYGGGAALPTGVLELVRAVEPRRAGQPPTPAWRIDSADGPGFTADLVHTDRRHLSLALSLLANRVQAVAETDWARLLERAQARANPGAPRAEDPRRTAATKLLAALYGTHPFARRTHVSDLLALDPAAVPAALPRLYNPRNAVLVVAGDLDGREGAVLATTWFGAWQGASGTGRLDVPRVPAPGESRKTSVGREEVLITHRPVASQIELTFACRLAAPASPRETAAQRVVASLLEGILTERIREQAGATYSVDVRATSLAAGGAHLQVGMSVESRRLRDVLRVLRGEIAALAAGRIEKGAISQARWSLAQSDALRFQTGRELAKAVFETLARGLPPEAISSTTDQIRNVDERDLARAFAPCAATPILSLVGDETLIKAAL